MLRHAATVGLYAVILYAVCLVWRYALADAEIMRLHLSMLKMMFPAFQGYDRVSIVWGVLLSFIYGVLASVIFHSIHTECCNGKKK